MHQADADREADQLGPIAQVQLPVDPVQVRVDGLARDTEIARDLG